MEILSRGTEQCAVQTTSQPLKLGSKIETSERVRKISAHFSISNGTSSMSIATDLLFNVSTEQKHIQKAVDSVNITLCKIIFKL